MPNSPENFEKIVEQCILMEIQAMTLYTMLANRVANEETGGMLRYLAEIEESHVGRLVEIFSRSVEGAEKTFANVDVVKAFQSDAWKMHKARLQGAGLTDTSPLDDYLAFAIVNETHARTHYDRLSAEASDPLVKDIFRTLSGEEAEHERQLTKLRESYRESR